MSFFSSLGSAISSVCSAVCSGIASVAGSGVTRVVGALNPILTVVNAIATVVTIVDTVARALGIWGQQETTEEMGDRALQAQEAGIRSEDYDNYDKYVKEIRRLELNPEKSKSYSTAERIVAGMGICYWGLESKYGKDTGDLLVHIAKDHEFFNEKRLGAYLDGIRSVSDVARYFSGKLNPDDNARVRDDLMQVEKSLDSSKSDLDIYRALNAHKE